MPVYTHLGDDYRKLGVGARIRKLRQERSLTLKALSRQLDVSIGTLSAIENERQAPDVELFVRIAKTLSLPFDRFLPAHETRPYLITRRGAVEDHPPLPIKMVDREREALMPYHNRLWPLAQSFVGKHLEPFAMDVTPVDDPQVRFIAHHQEEFLLVLRGSAECLLETPGGLRRERLHAGDCIYFPSILPHCIRSVGSEPARGIDVVCTSHEAADSELASGHDGLTMYLRDASPRSVVERIGSRFTALRQANGMQPGDFADRIGIPARRLRSIEEGRAHISLALVLELCRLFRKPPDYFFRTEATNPPYFAVTRSRQIRRMPPTAPSAKTVGRCFSGASVRALATSFEGRAMIPSLITLSAKRSITRTPVAHQGQEFVYVLAGAVRLITAEAGKRVTDDVLFPGDSCFLDASTPHRFCPVRDHPWERGDTRLLVVSWNPSGDDRARQVRLGA